MLPRKLIAAWKSAFCVLTRKVIVAWLSASWFSILFVSIFNEKEAFIPLFLLVLFYSGIVTLFYGVPVSFFIDFLTKKCGLRRLTKLLIYGLFGFLLILGYCLWSSFDAGVFTNNSQDILNWGLNFIPRLLIYGFLGFLFIPGYYLWGYIDSGLFIAREFLYFGAIGVFIAILGGILDELLCRRNKFKKVWVYAVFVFPIIALLISLYHVFWINSVSPHI